MIPQIKNDHPERQIITIRVFNVPSQTVFSAWRDSELLKKWWGPKDLPTPFMNLICAPAVVGRL